MMFQSAIDSPVAVIVENATVLFPPLTLGDLAQLGAKWATEDQAELRRRLTECAAPAELSLAERTKLAERTQDLSYVFTCLANRGRAMEVLAKSLERSGRPPKEAAEFVASMKIKNINFIDAVMRVCGVGPAQEGDEDGPPKAPAPPTGGSYSQPSRDTTGLIQPT